MKLEDQNGVYFIRGSDVSVIKPLKDSGTSYTLDILVRGQWISLCWKYKVPDMDMSGSDKQMIHDKALNAWNTCVTESCIR